MKETMYDILKKAVQEMRTQGSDCIDCNCETHGNFKVYLRG